VTARLASIVVGRHRFRARQQPWRREVRGVRW
jgi:hypothetical protein